MTGSRWKALRRRGTHASQNGRFRSTRRRGGLPNGAESIRVVYVVDRNEGGAGWDEPGWDREAFRPRHVDGQPATLIGVVQAGEPIVREPASAVEDVGHQAQAPASRRAVVVAGVVLVTTALVLVGNSLVGRVGDSRSVRPAVGMPFPSQWPSSSFEPWPLPSQGTAATPTPATAVTPTPPVRPSRSAVAVRVSSAVPRMSSPPAVPPVWTTLTIQGTWVLKRGESVQTNRTRLAMLADGDLVIIDEYKTVRWRSGTAGHGDFVVFQSDGHLVVYDNSMVSWWQSGTPGHDGAVLVLQADGDVCIVFNGAVIWRSGTAH